MQRRAVAVYAVVFLLIGTASYALIATADEPEVTFENPDHELTEGSEFEIDGTTYTATTVGTEEVEDHGVTHTEFVGEIEWEETRYQSEEWANNSTVTYDGGEWRVLIHEDGTGFTLHEQQDRQAILQNDSEADNETVESDGEEYVVVRDEEGNATLVPAEEYFPEPGEREFAAGDAIQYDGHDATVGNVTAEAAVVEWEAETMRTEELDHRSNVTLAGTDYVVFFQDEDTVVLSSDHEAYQAQLAEMDAYEQRSSGLFRIAALSLLAVVLLSMIAFLPSRY